MVNQRRPGPKSYNVAGLFAGIGGIELGFERAGHKSTLLCENDPSAAAVLNTHFKDVALHSDVRTLEDLPVHTNLIAAGFPCQDLSQAGQTRGLEGNKSSLVSNIFRLLEKNRVECVVLENVPFMLQLDRGRAAAYLLSRLEDLGYKWAYRIVDSRAFGVPQRRRRVYLVACISEDPRNVLFADDAGIPEDSSVDWRSVASGFYWTEGVRGLGWAVDSIPTLKGGSAVGIPSPPAIVLPCGDVVKPSLAAAERLQGFSAGWTKSAENAGRSSFRWRLVGNAVTVPVAKWLGSQLATPGRPADLDAVALDDASKMPNAAYNVDGTRMRVNISEWPKNYKIKPLLDFLGDSHEPLSVRATEGFLKRFKHSSLRKPDGFLEILEQHLSHMRT